MSEDIWQAVARLRRAQPRNPDTLVVCAAYEAAVQHIRTLEESLANARAARKVEEADTATLFDRRAYMREYMREYMRKRRANAKEAK